MFLDLKGSDGDRLESYIKERKQFSAAKGHQSPVKNITFICLSPLLCVIYHKNLDKSPEF